MFTILLMLRNKKNLMLLSHFLLFFTFGKQTNTTILSQKIYKKKPRAIKYPIKINIKYYKELNTINGNQFICSHHNQQYLIYLFRY